MRPLTIKESNITEIEIIEDFFKFVTNNHYREKLSLIIKKLKKIRPAQLSLIIKEKSISAKLIIRVTENRRIKTTLIITKCNSIKKLNLCIGLVQLIQEDLSLSLGLEPSNQLIFIPILEVHRIINELSEK